MSIKSFAIGITVGGAIDASLGRAFRSVRSKQNALNKAIRDTSAQHKAASEYLKYKQTLEKLKEKQAALAKSSPRLAEGISVVEQKLRKAEKAANKYGLKLGKIAQEEERLGKALDEARFKQQLYNTHTRNQSIRRQAQGQILSIAGMAYSVAAPIRVAVDFEQSIAKLGAITQSTKPQLKQLSKTAQTLGRTTQFSASEAAQAMTFLGMAGFKTNQILQATPGLLDLAQASGSDLGQTADIASNILSGFGLKANQMSRVGDVLSKTFTSSNVTLEMLGETMKYVAPAAASAGANIEEVAAMAGLLGNVGIQGSQAGTALRMAFIRLAKPPKMAQDAMDELGLSIKDAQGNMRSMPDILQEIALKTQDLGQADKLVLMTKLFGTEAASAMIELSKQAGSGALDKYVKQLQQAHGITQKMAKQMGETTYGALKRLGSAFESVAISLGTLALPAIVWVADGLSYVASSVAEFGQTFPNLSAGLIGVIGGMVTLKVVVFATKFAFSFFSDAIVFARMAFSGLVTVLPMVIAGVKALSLALMANPIGLIVSGIAIAAGTIIYYWKPIKSFFSGLWDGVKEKFTAFTSWVTGWGKKIGQVVKSVFEASPIGLAIKAGAMVTQWLKREDEISGQKMVKETVKSYQPPVLNSGTTQSIKHTTVHAAPTFNITQQPGENSDTLSEKIMQSFQDFYSRLETDVP